MTALLLDGKSVALQLKLDIKQAVEKMIQQSQRAPGLAVILVGEDPASQIYVKNKRKACLDVGFNSYAYDLPPTVTEEALLDLIDQLNRSSDVDGILVQLPLPKQINALKIIERINPYKDVDGFHPYNVGRLTLRHPLLRSCTPYGIMKLLEHYHIPIAGKHAVVVGASNIVGRPMAMEFLLAAATVTICHRFTEPLERHVRMADILVVATGVADVIDLNWLHAQQVVVDVGIHRLEDGSLRGDLDFNKAKNKVAWLTPVPGGVGPMTIATLLQNTLYAAGFCL